MTAKQLPGKAFNLVMAEPRTHADESVWRLHVYALFGMFSPRGLGPQPEILSGVGT